MGSGRKTRKKESTSVTLKSVADYVGLTPGTVSAVLNDAPSARSIPEHTKKRIHAAALDLNYRPNFFARTRLGFELEHEMNRVVGQRFRALLTLDLTVLK